MTAVRMPDVPRMLLQLRPAVSVSGRSRSAGGSGCPACTVPTPHRTPTKHDGDDREHGRADICALSSHTRVLEPLRHDQQSYRIEDKKCADKSKNDGEHAHGYLTDRVAAA